MSLADTDQRFQALIDWLENTLCLEVQHIEAASSDASFRRYFRVKHNQGQHVVMDAPPEREATEPFMRVAALFKTVMHVPEIYSSNSQQGFLLLEDLGNTSLLGCLTAETVDGFYHEACANLFNLQTKLTRHHCQLPEYDAVLLTRELDIFNDWFLEKHCHLVLPFTIKNDLYQVLIDSALAQPQVCVHRDYHSRNLMVLADGSLAIIDFQDAVIGPICYDLVSLLRDCYIRWPSAKVAAWAENYYQQLLSAKMLHVDFIEFKRWFDLMGLQRHLKAIGIFARLHLRDNKSNYLADIPRTLRYIFEVSALYPELETFNDFINKQLITLYPDSL